MTKRLEIVSSNHDIEGVWFKEDVEDEIKDILGRDPESETEWISWVFGHAFDDMGVEVNTVLEAVAHSEWILEIKFKTPGHDTVTIYKE